MSTCSECRDLEGTDIAERAETGAPTNWWHCRRCNRHLNRFRGTGDQSCTCGAWYNTAGQQLRDDWTDNPAWRDDDVDDMEGYEQSCLRSEAHTR